jgi:hypothetical protein
LNDLVNIQHAIGQNKQTFMKKIANKIRGRSAKQTNRIQPARQAATRMKDLPSFLAERFKSLGIDEAELKALQEFIELKEEDKISAARKIVQTSIIEATEKPDSRFPLAISASQDLLRGYATLDEEHRFEIRKITQEISSYLKDSSRKRPLNCLMLAAPGAGKSHFIKQLAGSMKAENVQAVTFNMATMQSHDDMAQPVDELRNLKVNDRFPLLFLDEFDSDPARYAALLPLLWDGELHIGHRDLKLGKAVIVLAGSNPDLPKAMDESAKMQLDGDAGTEHLKLTGKLIDLLSRINGGVINIPDLDLRSETRDRRVDKVCVAISLLRGRFGDQLSRLPRSLLRFIAHTKFRYGVRSIAHLIDVIPSTAFQDNNLKVEKLKFPFESEKSLRESNLRLHLVDKDQAFGIVNRWKEFSRDKVIVNLQDRNEFHYLRRLYQSKH